MKRNMIFCLTALMICSCLCNITETLIIMKEKKGWHNPQTGDFVGYLCISLEGDKYLLRSNEEFEVGTEIYGKFSKPTLMQWKTSGVTKTVKLIRVLSKRTTSKDIEELKELFSE